MVQLILLMIFHSVHSMASGHLVQTIMKHLQVVDGDGFKIRTIILDV